MGVVAYVFSGAAINLSGLWLQFRQCVSKNSVEHVHIKIRDCKRIQYRYMILFLV